MGDLFRPEVVAARAERLHGAVLLTQPLRYWTLGLVLTAAVSGAGAWAIGGSYARVETAPGLLNSLAPVAKVYATRAGVVTSVGVSEGQHVRVGAPLAVIQLSHPDRVGANPEAASLGAIEIQESIARESIAREHQRAEAERRRLAKSAQHLEAQHSHLESQIELQVQIAASAKSTFEQVGSLVDKGFVSRLEHERRRQAWLAEEQRSKSLEQQAGALATEIEQTRAELDRLPLDVAGRVAQLQTSQQTLVQERANVGSGSAYRIEAPISGTVTAVQTAAGRLAEPRVPIMAIVPNESRLVADVFAPSRAVGFIRSGQDVRLLFDAFPYQRFGSFKGTVVSVSHTIIAPNELDAPIQVKEPVYRVRIALADQSLTAFGEKVALQPGMTLSANIVLERRSFIDWLLQPLRAVGSRS